MRKTSFEPLTGVLEPWFESDELPEAIQERIKQGFPPGGDSPNNRGAMLLALKWKTLGPGQRREAARQWDYNNDPANEAEQNRMFELQSLQFELEDRITKIEIGAVKDATGRDIHLQKLKKEFADVGDAIFQLTTEEAEVYPPRLGPVPQKTYISACEALTWIAWGQATTLEEINRIAEEKCRRWGAGDLAPLLAALIARAARTPHSPSDPRVLRNIRRRARQRTGRLVTYQELASELANEIERDTREDQLLAQAATDLMEAVRAEAITARGQRRHPDGQKNRSAEHSIIPRSVLIDPRTTVTHHNQILVNPNLDFSEATDALGKAYDDVEFKKSEIVEHWPATDAAQIIPRPLSSPAPAEASSSHGRRQNAAIAKEQVPRENLPAYWTWYQTIAWIMFRDTAFVKEVLGAAPIRFSLLIAWRHQHGRPAIIASPDDAESTLIESAKSIDIQVKGRLSGNKAVDTIPPVDWCTGKMTDERDQRALDLGTGLIWYDLLLPRDTIIDRWHPAGMKLAETHAPAPAPDGTIFIDDAIERLRARHGGISDGPAIKLVLDVLASTEVRTWLRVHKLYRIEQQVLHADSWHGAYIDLDEFRNGRGGVRLNGKAYHLHRVLVSDGDFNDWLTHIPSALTDGERRTDSPDATGFSKASEASQVRNAKSIDGTASAALTRRENRVSQWAERMRRSREWIGFADIADWCAREKGSIIPDDRLKIETYRALGASVASGEFEHSGRSRVVYTAAMIMPGYPVRIRMTRETFDACPFPKQDTLEWCWIPRDLCRSWFEGRRLPLPPWISEGGGAVGKARGAGLQPKKTINHPVPNAQATPLPKKKRGPSDAKRKAAVDRMREDIRSERQSLLGLQQMKQEALASIYGLKSRDTARKALAEAAQFVGVSNTDK